MLWAGEIILYKIERRQTNKTQKYTDHKLYSKHMVNK